ncbi:MAG: hypothetical protein C0469_15395 [Cyanobacteria bacterium DS2.3.42]|nr:hypothetical protein [Cyanobacteria bacterium DS2.3.42]
MSIHTTDAVSEGSAVIDQAEDESSLHAEVRQLLEKADAYKQSPTEVPYVPNLQISNNEHFATADLNLSATTDAIPVPHAETAKTDAGFFGVVGDIIGGGIHHVLTNPMDVVHSLATGVVLSVAIGAGIAGATALAATAPAWVPIAGAVALAAGAGWLTGWMAAEHVPKWWNDADTVWNSSKHTDEEVAAARQGLQDLGGGTVDFLAGMVGGGWIYNQLAKTAMKTGTDAAANEIRVANAEVNAVSESAEQAATVRSKAAAESGEQVATTEIRGASEGAEASTAQSLDMETFFKKLDESRGPKPAYSSYDDISEVPEALRGWATSNKVLFLGAGHGVPDSHLAALKYLTDPREISYFSKYISDDLTNPLTTAAEIRRAVGAGVTDTTTKQAWLDSAKAIEGEALKKLVAQDVSKFTPQELASHEYSIKALIAGKNADSILDRTNALQLSELTAGKTGQEIAETLRTKAYIMDAPDAQMLAFRSLTNPRDIDEFATYLTSQEQNPAAIARSIREQIHAGNINPSTLSTWSATAARLEAEAIPKLETLLKSLNGVDDPAVAHLRSTLDGLKSGKTADVVEQEWRMLASVETKAAVEAPFPTGLTGDDLMQALKNTAEQSNEGLVKTAIQNLSKAEDVTAFAQRYAGSNGMEYIEAANNIRRYPFFTSEQSAQLRDSWLSAAEVLEAKALPLLRESATSHSWLKPPSPAELRSSQRLLAGLESGLKADRLIGDMNAARLAIEEPGQAVRWIGKPGEIETFLDEYRIMHPDFRKEVETAIKSGAIPKNRAAQWEMALQTMPKSQDAARVSIAVSGKGPQIFQAVEEAAHKSILPTDQYALLHLKDRAAIESFTAEWKKKFPNVNDFAVRIAEALKYKMVQPGSESAWDDAVDQLFKR